MDGNTVKTWKVNFFQTAREDYPVEEFTYFMFLRRKVRKYPAKN